MTGYEDSELRHTPVRATRGNGGSVSGLPIKKWPLSRQKLWIPGSPPSPVPPGEICVTNALKKSELL